MEKRKYIRANALPVTVLCPVCSELRIIEFEADDLEDPAFAECYKSQPLKIPCHECEALIFKAADSREELEIIHGACLRGEPWSIKYVRQLIQES